MNATAETPGLKAPWFPYRVALPKLTNEVEGTVAALEQAPD